MLKISAERLIRFCSSSVADVRLVTSWFPVDMWPLVQRSLRTCCWISTELHLCFLSMTVSNTVKSQTISMLVKNRTWKHWGGGWGQWSSWTLPPRSRDRVKRQQTGSINPLSPWIHHVTRRHQCSGVTYQVTKTEQRRQKFLTGWVCCRLFPLRRSTHLVSKQTTTELPNTSSEGLVWAHALFFFHSVRRTDPIILDYWLNCNILDG